MVYAAGFAAEHTYHLLTSGDDLILGSFEKKPDLKKAAKEAIEKGMSEETLRNYLIDRLGSGYSLVVIACEAANIKSDFVTFIIELATEAPEPVPIFVEVSGPASETGLVGSGESYKSGSML
ncbi:MAG: hypothetical protein AAF542_00120 [Pseudomonadota bacterium]